MSALPDAGLVTIAPSYRVSRVLGAALAATAVAAVGAGAPSRLPGSHSTDGAVGRQGRAPTDVELTPAVHAAFSSESYAPGSTALLRVSNRARGLTLRIFRVGATLARTTDNVTMHGIAVTGERAVGSSSGNRRIRVAVGDWSSGLYFARLEADDGRVGFAPFVVRPSRLGEHRVAVVLPTSAAGRPGRGAQRRAARVRVAPRFPPAPVPPVASVDEATTEIVATPTRRSNAPPAATTASLTTRSRGEGRDCARASRGKRPRRRARRSFLARR